MNAGPPPATVCPLLRAAAVAFLTLPLPLPAAAGSRASADPPRCLARVEVDRPLDQLKVPVYAHLVGGDGGEYALVKAPVAALRAAGLAYRILDDVAADSGYLLALERLPGARQQAARRYRPLHDDGRQVLLRAGPEVAEGLHALGMAVWRLPEQPLVLRAPPVRPMPAPAAYDPLVAAMVAQVEEETVLSYGRQLSGAEATTIGGASYTITRRQTNSGEPIDKATQFAAEHLERQGLSASYQSWSGSGYSCRNVAAVLPGTERADEIVLVTAHIDDMPASGPAPGADDNASGSVAVMLAAEIMRHYTFERTVHFVFFTGEEQGLLGSDAYAQALYDAGADVVAVLNLDMIAYENVGDPVATLHTRGSWNPGYAADREIADTFVDVVSLYGLSGDLVPVVVADGMGASDHAEFWNRGFPAILAIEDYPGDFNPYYHKTTDTVDKLAPAYFTAFVKAAVATVAHLAGPTGTVCTAPQAPDLSAPASASSGTPYLVSWTPTSADGTYVVEEAREPTFAAASSFQLAATAATFLHTSAGGSFHYRVRAVEACGGGSVASEWSGPAAVSLEGGSGCGLEVADRTIAGAEVFLSCGELFAGPNLEVAASGAATLRAATAVVVRNGFRVAAGARLAAGTDPTLAEP